MSWLMVNAERRFSHSLIHDECVLCLRVYFVFLFFALTLCSANNTEHCAPRDTNLSFASSIVRLLQYQYRSICNGLLFCQFVQSLVHFLSTHCPPFYLSFYPILIPSICCHDVASISDVSLIISFWQCDLGLNAQGYCFRWRYKTRKLKVGFHYPSSRAELTARELGCIFWYPSTQAVNSGSGNRP